MFSQIPHLSINGRDVNGKRFGDLFDHAFSLGLGGLLRLKPVFEVPKNLMRYRCCWRHGLPLYSPASTGMRREKSGLYFLKYS